MESEFVSPPKTLRNVLQPIPFNDGSNQSLNRSRNSIKKKLQIEQENYDPSNNVPYHTFKHAFFFQKSDSFGPLISEISSLVVSQMDISSLPYEVHLEILKFISPQEIITTIQYINKHWHKIANDTGLWKFLDETQKLSVDLKYLKQKCIIERRSRGKLFKAISRVTKEPIVIRRINLSVANGGHDDGVPTSILREISYLTNLSHPNISKIIEVEVRKEIIQTCSQYLTYNLREYMKLFLTNTVHKHEKNRFLQALALKSPNNSQYKLPLRNIKRITYQVLKGLNYLHHNGIIHRNLKTDNVLINEDGVVKIYDFALSKVVTVPHTPYTPEDPKDRERSGREARRLWYRAPELLLRKKKYSFETDIWAFGCLLAELATNETLFNGETEIEQLFKIFSLVGSPNASTWGTVCDEEQYKILLPNWESVYFPFVCYPPDRNEFIQVSKTLLPNREKAFNKLRSLGAVLGKSGLDLLWSCLSLNPQLRSNANSLLNHEFFEEVRHEFEPNYQGSFECKNDLCKYSGFYDSFESPECHLASYFKVLKGREKELSPSSKYLEDQSALTEHMRCILVDWLIDVSLHFNFLDETLHLAVNFIDRFIIFLFMFFNYF